MGGLLSSPLKSKTTATATATANSNSNSSGSQSGNYGFRSGRRSRKSNLPSKSYESRKSQRANNSAYHKGRIARKKYQGYHKCRLDAVQEHSKSNSIQGWATMMLRKLKSGVALRSDEEVILTAEFAKLAHSPPCLNAKPTLNI